MLKDSLQFSPEKVTKVTLKPNRNQSYKHLSFMKKLLFTIGLTLFCGTVGAQNSALFKAQALETKNDYAGAAAILEEALNNPKTTKFAEMYNRAAECNAHLFNAELDNAAKGLPFDTANFVNRLEKMVTFYTKSHEADVKPDHKGRVKSKFVAANHMRMMFMLDYYNYAAMFMYQNHNMDKAMEYFEKYLEMPDNPIFSKAESDSIRAAKKAEYSQTINNLAQLNFTRKNWDKAIKYADAALQDSEGTRDLYIIKMQSYASKGDSTQWLNTLVEAVNRTENEGLMQNLIYYYYSHNDVVGAEKMANEMVTTSPDSKAAWYMKGCVELNLKKDYPAARECFAKALAIDPDFIDANINIASTYVNQVVTEKMDGKFKFVGTGKSITKAQMPAYQKELDYVHSFYKNALPHMEKVRSLQPDKPRSWAYTLQMIYDNLQMKAEKEEMDKIIEGL